MSTNLSVCPETRSEDILKLLSANASQEGVGLDVPQFDLETIHHLNWEDYIDALSLRSGLKEEKGNITLTYSDYCNTVNANGLSQSYFLFRLFSSFRSTLSDIGEMLSALPEEVRIQELRNQRRELIFDFCNNPLGAHWVKSMIKQKFLNSVIYYYNHNRKTISADVEQNFFDMLDKIFIITDILKGNAERYDVNVDYSADKACRQKKVEKKNERQLVRSTFMKHGITDYHITVIYQELMKCGWISENTTPESFLNLFSGEQNDCRIVWISNASPGNLRYLFKTIMDQGLISVPSNVGYLQILESHFVDKEGKNLQDLRSGSTSAKGAEIVANCMRILNVDISSALNSAR